MNLTQASSRFYRHGLRLLIPALALAALHGCATIAPAADAGSLRQRAEAYWKARLAGDRVAAFDYEEHKARGTQTLQAYVKKNPPIFLKVTITDVQVFPENRGLVSLDTSYTVPGLPSKTPIVQKMQDDWTVVDGRWYHVDKPVSLIQKKTTELKPAGTQ